MMQDASFLPMAELKAGLDRIRQSPRDVGVLELIARRPATNEREVIAEGELTQANGLVGDSWLARGGWPNASDPADPECQLNIMNARAAALVAQDRDRWALAGDQLYIDFELSDDNAPVGTRLAIGAAVIEITAPPHTGCEKFSARFGTDATKFVNSPEGKRLHLRGVNARVICDGAIRTGDAVRKLSPYEL